jgi:hypothetical protein
MHNDMGSLTYAACGVLILVYAWDRFNTPPSNRSSTRRALYWSSCAGYMISALALFVALSTLLEFGAWRTTIISSGDNPALPPPLIATLAMTTLLSSCPALKRLDAWILNTFLEWGAIPAEVKRRAAIMLPRSFSVAKEDLPVLRDAYADDCYGRTFSSHLRERGSDGIELSEYRLTRVAKLFQRINELRGLSRYSRFFAESAAEFDGIERQTVAFLRRSDTSLTLAARLANLEESTAYEELLAERQEQFAQGCHAIFADLALFLARAVLRSERSESDIVHRLREIGFATAEPMNEPDFPINGLTLLALGVFLYLASLSIFFSHVRPGSQPHSGVLVMVFKIALTRLVTVGVTVWLVQRFDVFRRGEDEAPKYFAYVLCGFIACVVATGVCLPFALFDMDPMTSLRNSTPLIVLSGLLCSVLALCCNDWPRDATPPFWLRWAEAAGCASVMVFGTGFMYLSDTMPASIGPLHGWMVAAWIALPSTMALMIGLFVPHIYRGARHAAAARRNEAMRRMAARQDVIPSAPVAQIGVRLSAQGSRAL